MDVLEALQGWYLTHSALALAGGFWLDRAPQRTVLPYAVAVFLSETPAYLFGETHTIEVDFQISVFAASATEAKRLALLWSRKPNGLDFAALSAPGSVVINCQRSRSRLRRDEGALSAPGAEDCWIGEHDYQVTLSRRSL